MPLNKSGSKKSMNENIKTEMEHGKPQKQAIAIAYATRRHAMAKKAKGGNVEPESYDACEHCYGTGYAQGGMVEYEAGGKIGTTPTGDQEPKPDLAISHYTSEHLDEEDNDMDDQDEYEQYAYGGGVEGDNPEPSYSVPGSNNEDYSHDEDDEEMFTNFMPEPSKSSDEMLSDKSARERVRAALKKSRKY